MSINYVELVCQRLPKPRPPRAVLTLRMDWELRDKLQAIADARGTSLSETCVSMLETDVMLFEHQRANQNVEVPSHA